MVTTMVQQAKRMLVLALLIPLIAACGATGTGTTAPTAASGGTAATADTSVEATTAAEATTAPEATTESEATMAPEMTMEPEATVAAEATTAAGSAGGAALPEIDFASLSGAVNIDGSSTVEPLTLAIAEEFAREASGVQVTVGRAGTGGGFERFCRGETDANNASRAIRDTETQACTEGSVTPVELFLGLDGLTVVVNPENTFVQGLTYAQLQSIFQEGGATTWDQVDPSFPAEPIEIYAPDADSGTYDFFAEEVGLRGPEEEELAFRTDYTASADDNTLVTGIEGSQYAIGFFGYAYYEQEGDRLRAVPIAEEGTEFVEPSAETVESGDYPLSRPLFIYPSVEALTTKPQVAGFMQFYLENVRDIIVDVGYFPGSDERYDEAAQNLASALGQ